MSAWTEFKTKWQDCRLCPLCETRKHICIARGSLPCDLLFIGEAPGASEDVLGVPFKGPAGHKLNEIIAKVVPERIRCAFTNIVCCIPKGDDGLGKIPEPPKASIEACGPRLREFFMIAQPKRVVFVGDLAETWVPKILGDLLNYVDMTGKIPHPARILRAADEQKPVLYQECLVNLSDIIEGL